MHLMLNKTLPLCFLFIGTSITLSASSWLMAWAGLEVNMMAFIPMILINNKLSNESALKYFFIQVSGSIIIFLSTIIMMKNNNMNSMDISNLIMKSLIPLALLLKLGAAPMHFWFPQVMEGLNWMSTMLLLTWQKIAPLFLLTTYNMPKILIYTTVFLSAITGAMGGLNQLLLRKILAYSSINHLAWMAISSLISLSLLTTYFIIYSLITITIILLLKSNNFIHLTQLMNNHYSMSIMSTSLFLNLLSLGGMPPFLGFFPKWIILNSISYNMMLISAILVMCSVLTLYFYMRISFNLLMMTPKLMWFNKKLVKFSPTMKMMSMLPITTLPLMMLT
uniref:NADH-ubiquinone oxidoreductase chain 2 n=1 Tax=Pseudotibiozus cerasopus TaxID=2931677 RepID=A0A8T9JAH0_9MYRI|nr:NADH dehydrogenase subunit 2 [Pseudotibiozus cerasopus]UOF70231.1 NADH dehydrogenase subunit 2 [Pseudotibiozus cerasopus]